MTHKIIYHGTNYYKIEPNPVYDYNRIANGLGFYWTNCKDEAATYGKNIFERELAGYKLINEFDNEYAISIIRKWFKKALLVNPERVATAASNFNEDFNKGLEILIDNVHEHNTALEQWFAFQSELMLRDTQSFCDIAQAIGIDGVEIIFEESGNTHYVLYR